MVTAFLLSGLMNLQTGPVAVVNPGTEVSAGVEVTLESSDVAYNKRPTRRQRGTGRRELVWN